MLQCSVLGTKIMSINVKKHVSDFFFGGSLVDMCQIWQIRRSLLEH